MKNTFKWLAIAAIVAVPALTFTSCDKDDNNNSSIRSYRADATGAKAVPANSSTATATFTGTYDYNSKTLNGTVSYSGMTPTGWYIQRGTETTYGSVALSLGAVVSSPLSFTATLDASAEAELESGAYYLNVQSAAYPTGEVRGKIVATSN